MMRPTQTERPADQDLPEPRTPGPALISVLGLWVLAVLLSGKVALGGDLAGAIGWQALAALLAIVAYALSRRLPDGAASRIARWPLRVALAFLVVLAATWLAPVLAVRVLGAG